MESTLDDVIKYLQAKEYNKGYSLYKLYEIEYEICYGDGPIKVAKKSALRIAKILKMLTLEREMDKVREILSGIDPSIILTGPAKKLSCFVFVCCIFMSQLDIAEILYTDYTDMYMAHDPMSELFNSLYTAILLTGHSRYQTHLRLLTASIKAN